MAGATGDKPSAPAPAPLPEKEKNSKPFADDCMKPLENLFAFLRANNLPDNHGTSVLYQVHEDLRLIRKWTDLRVLKGGGRAYLAGSAAAAFDSVFPGAEEGAERLQVVVPMATSERLSPRALKALCATCGRAETGERLRCVTIAIVDDDSTTAYYRIFDRFEEIVHKQWKQKKKRPRNEDAAQGTDERDAGAAAKGGAESESGASDSDSE